MPLRNEGKEKLKNNIQSTFVRAIEKLQSQKEKMMEEIDCSF